MRLTPSRMLNGQREDPMMQGHRPPKNLLVIAGPESFAIDMAELASRFTRVALLRWTTPEFDGSLFELFSIGGDRVRKVSMVRVPFRARRRYQWYASRLPMFLINTFVMFLLAVRGRKVMRGSASGVSGLGVGWGGALITMLMRRFLLVKSFAYYRDDWFVGRPHHNYDFLTVNVFFRMMDRVISRHAQYVWNVTDAVRVAARRTHHFESSNELIVRPPVKGGLQLGNDHRVADPYIVYCGEVKPGCGLPMILGALRVLQAQNRFVKLKVLGRARDDYLTDLHRNYGEVFDNGVCEYLGGFNLGDEDDRNRVNQIVADAYAGMAIYPDGQSNTSNYVIPNRMLLYLTNHTPILVNADSTMAGLLCSAGVAIATTPAPESIAKSVLSIWDSFEHRSWLKSNIGPFMADFGNTIQTVKALRQLTGSL